jgi:hypothetical protein
VETDIDNCAMERGAVILDEGKGLVDRPDWTNDLGSGLLKLIGDDLSDKIVVLNEENPTALERANLFHRAVL